MTLGQGQEMTVIFNTHIPLLTHQSTFRSQTAIVSEKATVYTFSYRKA